MLTLVQASRIVRDCIRTAVGWTGPINGGDKLNEVGIVDPDAREALNDEIVTNESRGVQSEGHRLGPDDLTFTIATRVFELRDEVFEKAVPDTTFMNALVGVGTFGGADQEGDRAAKKSAGKPEEAGKKRQKAGGMRKKSTKKGS